MREFGGRLFCGDGCVFLNGKKPMSSKRTKHIIDVKNERTSKHKSLPRGKLLVTKKSGESHSAGTRRLDRPMEDRTLRLKNFPKKF